MINNFNAVQKLALEACIDDTVSFMDLYLRIKEHPKAALLFNGLIAHASMFVIENHRCLTTLFPDSKSYFHPSFSELIRQSRHRAKLLDNSKKSIEEITMELDSIAKRQREIFLEPHRGFSGLIKKRLQPDMGLYIYENHIFTTTHTVVYAFGKESEFSESAFTFGREIGAFTGRVFRLFQIEIPSASKHFSEFPDKIEMRDIKYESLYNRSTLDTCDLGISAGLILILANLNFVIYILSGLLPASNPFLFRMKFLTTFHANISMNFLQDKLIKSDASPKKIMLFNDALINDDSKWLKDRRQLRNLLTHYLPDKQLRCKLQPSATRIDAIELLSGGLSFTEVNCILDRNLVFLANLIENFFTLIKKPFSFGKVE